MKIKQDKLQELTKVGFKKLPGDYTLYVLSLRVGDIMINGYDRCYNYHLNKVISSYHMEEITRISNQLIADRHDVNIMIDILIEKGMLEDE